MIEPYPEITMRKEIHPKNSRRIGKRPVKFPIQPQVAKDRHNDQCCPILNLHRTGRCARKRFNLEVLFQDLKKDSIRRRSLSMAGALVASRFK
jgi:hypothetical protein